MKSKLYAISISFDVSSAFVNPASCGFSEKSCNEDQIDHEMTEVATVLSFIPVNSHSLSLAS